MPAGYYPAYDQEPEGPDFFYFAGNDRARFVLVWNGRGDCFSCPNADPTALLPSDLDMVVVDFNGAELLNAAGNRVGYSLSFDNNYEVIDLDVRELLARGYRLPFRIRVKGYKHFDLNETFVVGSYGYDSVQSESPP